MRPMRILKGFTICFALFVVSGPFVFSEKSHAETTSMEDVQKELSEAMEAIQNYSADRKNDAVNDMKKALEKMDQQIAQLGEKIKKDWEAMEPEAREKADQTMETLRRQRDEMAKYIDELKESGAEAWDKLREELMKRYQDFKDGLENADKRYNDSTIYL